MYYNWDIEMYYFIGFFFWGKQTPVTNQESLILWIYGPSKYTSCSDTPKRKAKKSRSELPRGKKPWWLLRISTFAGGTCHVRSSPKLGRDTGRAPQKIGKLIFETSAKWDIWWRFIKLYCSYTGWWYTYPSEKYESQLGWLFPIYGKIKHVPNHQPV